MVTLQVISGSLDLYFTSQISPAGPDSADLRLNWRMADWLSSSGRQAAAAEKSFRFHLKKYQEMIECLEDRRRGGQEGMMITKCYRMMIWGRPPSVRQFCSVEPELIMPVWVTLGHGSPHLSSKQKLLRLIQFIFLRHSQGKQKHKTGKYYNFIFLENGGSKSLFTLQWLGGSMETWLAIVFSSGVQLD